MNKPQKERSIGTANRNKPDNSHSGNKQLLESEKIPGTPFTAVKADNIWFLTLGKYRLTKPLRTKNQCIHAAKDASWDRIMQIIQIMITENENEKHLKEIPQYKPDIKTE